jgi:hypothetical protein
VARITILLGQFLSSGLISLFVGAKSREKGSFLSRKRLNLTIWAEFGVLTVISLDWTKLQGREVQFTCSSKRLGRSAKIWGRNPFVEGHKD